MRILLVEDDLRIAEFVCRGLREEEFTVDHRADGEQGLSAARSPGYDLLILDVMLPARTGLGILQALRGEGITTPALLLTARGRPRERVEGLEAGADDYLPKPFEFEELLARVRALLRRRGGLFPETLRLADVEMNLRRHRVSRSGRPLVLTNREYALLELLLRRPNELVTREQLARQIWAQEYDPSSNVINVYMTRLRTILDKEFSPPLLHTIRGQGYMLRTPTEEPASSAA